MSQRSKHSNRNGGASKEVNPNGNTASSKEDNVTSTTVESTNPGIGLPLVAQGWTNELYLPLHLIKNHEPIAPLVLEGFTIGDVVNGTITSPSSNTKIDQVFEDWCMHVSPG